MLSFRHLYTVDQFQTLGIGNISDSVRSILLDMESQLEIVEYPVAQETHGRSRHHSSSSRFGEEEEEDNYPAESIRRPSERKSGKDGFSSQQGFQSQSLDPKNTDGSIRGSSNGGLTQRRLAPQTTFRMGRPNNANVTNNMLMDTRNLSSTPAAGTSSLWSSSSSLREIMGQTVVSKPSGDLPLRSENEAAVRRQPLVTTVMPDEQWELIRSFKATKIETKTGVDKIINDIRIILNKMTPSTVDKQKEALMEQCHQYFATLARKEEGEEEEKKEKEGEGEEGDPDLDNNTQRLAQSIFDITSSNRCYADIYASVMVDLVREFSVFQERLDDFVHHFLEKSQQIEYRDPDVDYDGYCAYVKQADARKATAAFISECCKRGIVSKSEMIDILCETLDIVLEQKDQPNKTKEVEELAEMAYILVTSLRPIMTEEPRWQDSVQQEIERICKLKSKDHKSLSNRAVFKFMDMLKK